MNTLSSTKKSTSNDHDSLFSTALSDPRVNKDLLLQHLPPTFLIAIDLNTLEICKDKFVDANLDSRVTDMLFRVKLKGHDQDAYIATLLEHRSTPQKYMPLRILHYECSIMKGHLKLYGRVPLVFSLVYYNGKKRWRYPLDIKGLIDAPSQLIERYALKPFQLVELNQISDETLRQHMWSGLMGTVMKHIYDRDIMPVFENILGWLKDIEHLDGHDFVLSLLYYIYKKGDVRDKAKYHKFKTLINSQLSEDTGAEIMTTMAQLDRQEGIQQGMQQGIQQGIQQGMQQGERKLLLCLLEHRFGSLSSYYLARLNTASDHQLLAWSKRCLEAKTLKDVFSD